MRAWGSSVLARLTLSQKLYILSFKLKSNGEINAIYNTVLYMPSDRCTGAPALMRSLCSPLPWVLRPLRLGVVSSVGRSWCYGRYS